MKITNKRKVTSSLVSAFYRLRESQLHLVNIRGAGSTSGDDPAHRSDSLVSTVCTTLDCGAHGAEELAKLFAGGGGGKKTIELIRITSRNYEESGRKIL